MLLKRVYAVAGSAVVASIVIATLPSACSSSDRTSASSDAGFSDGSRAPARPLDASTTGSDDAAGGFVAPTGTIPHFTDGWIPAPWAPGCNLYQPDSADDWAEIAPPTWVPCESGRAGCQQLDLNWAKTDDADVESISIGTASDGSSLLSFTRFYSGYQREYLVWDLSRNRPVAAWRHDGAWNCIEVPDGDISSGAYVLVEAVRSDPSSIKEYREIAGSPDSLLAKTAPDYVFAPNTIGVSSGDFPHQCEASAQLEALEFPATNRVVFRDRGTGNTKTIAAALDGAGPLQTPLFLMDRTAFYNRVTEADTWTVAAGEQSLVQHVGVQSHDFATDGLTSVWIEASNPNSLGFFPNGILYASPYTTDPTQLKAVSLGDPGCRFYQCGTRVSSGYVVTQAWPDADAPTHSIVIIRATDAATWRIDPVQTGSVAERFGFPGFVRNGELWQQVGEKPSELLTIMRISLAALGAPEQQ